MHWLWLADGWSLVDVPQGTTEDEVQCMIHVTSGGEQAGQRTGRHHITIIHVVTNTTNTIPRA